MQPLQPVELNRTEDRELVIRWSDGMEQTLPFRVVRSACQCAACMEKKMAKSKESVGQLNILSAAETAPLNIESMSPVGNYAYNIQFSDGHSSGIFSFELLRSLCSTQPE